MKTSSFVITLVVALVLGSGIAALIFADQRAATQVAQDPLSCLADNSDFDGDCVLNQNDYFPHDPLE
jgi:hypothetical protein